MTVQPISKALAPNESAQRPASAPAFEASEIITSAVLMDRLTNLFDEIEAAHEEVEKAANRKIEAEYKYELEWAKARIRMEQRDGSVKYKDAKATEETAEHMRDLGYAVEALRAAKKAEEIVQNKVSALQTVAANAREEMKLAGRLEPSDRTG